MFGTLVHEVCPALPHFADIGAFHFLSSILWIENSSAPKQFQLNRATKWVPHHPEVC